MTPEEITTLSTLMAEKVMGWHKYHHTYGWVWENNEGHIVTPPGQEGSTWSPAINPADCAMVMGEVRKRGWLYHIYHYERVYASIFTLDDPAKDHHKGYSKKGSARADSWTLAFCLAVKAMLEGK